MLVYYCVTWFACLTVQPVTVTMNAVQAKSYCRHYSAASTWQMPGFCGHSDLVLNLPILCVFFPINFEVSLSFFSSMYLKAKLAKYMAWLNCLGKSFWLSAFPWKNCFCEKYYNWLNRKLMCRCVIVSVKRWNFCCLTFHYELEMWQF